MLVNNNTVNSETHPREFSLYPIFQSFQFSQYNKIQYKSFARTLLLRKNSQSSKYLQIYSRFLADSKFNTKYISATSARIKNMS